MPLKTIPSWRQKEKGGDGGARPPQMSTKSLLLLLSAKVLAKTYFSVGNNIATTIYSLPWLSKGKWYPKYLGDFRTPHPTTVSASIRTFSNQLSLRWTSDANFASSLHVMVSFQFGYSIVPLLIGHLLRSQYVWWFFTAHCHPRRQCKIPLKSLKCFNEQIHSEEKIVILARY